MEYYKTTSNAIFVRNEDVEHTTALILKSNNPEIYHVIFNTVPLEENKLPYSASFQWDRKKIIEVFPNIEEELKKL